MKTIKKRTFQYLYNTMRNQQRFGLIELRESVIKVAHKITTTKLLGTSANKVKIVSLVAKIRNE